MESFCEEDYAITRYFAEFINTLTNLAYGMSASSLTNELDMSGSTKILGHDTS